MDSMPKPIKRQWWMNTDLSSIWLYFFLLCELLRVKIILQISSEVLRLGMIWNSSTNARVYEQNQFHSVRNTRTTEQENTEYAYYMSNDSRQTNRVPPGNLLVAYETCIFGYLHKMFEIKGQQRPPARKWFFKIHFCVDQLTCFVLSSYKQEIPGRMEMQCSNGGCFLWE